MKFVTPTPHTALMNLIFIRAEWVNNATTSEWPHFNPARNYSPGHEEVEGEHQQEKVTLEPSWGLCQALTSMVNSGGEGGAAGSPLGQTAALFPSQPEFCELPERLQTMSPASLLRVRLSTADAGGREG